MERVQEYCFERWPGQRVWRQQMAVFTNCTEQEHGYCSGTILAVGVYQKSIKECVVAWDSAITYRWDPLIRKYVPRVVFDDQIPDYAKIGRVFDCGLTTVFEKRIILAGGLLTEHGNYFDESQPDYVKEMIPKISAFVKAVEQYPEMTHWKV